MTKHTYIIFALCVLLLFPVVCSAEEASLPTPSSSPLPINDTYTKTIVTGDSIKIRTGNVTNNVVVYMEKERNVYHMAHCKLYKEKSGGDYSRPEWLGNVVMDSERCTECISDEEYHIYREAVYRGREKQNRQTIIHLINIIIVLTTLLLSLITVFFRKNYIKIQNDKE